VSWRRLRGHDALVRSFSHVIRRGRLAHAYVFAGPEGVGKHLFAKELAKAILCEDPHVWKKEVLEGCDHCPACVQIEADSHPDYYSVGKSPESHEFPIDLMREVCQQFVLKSARDKGKVIVLDDADYLNEESANCFLRTLEEPPPRSLVILISSSLERLLPTITSRCQMIRFLPLQAELVEEILQSHGGEQSGQKPIPADLLPRLVHLSGGSPGLALALADPALWDFRHTFLAGLTHVPLDSTALSKQWLAFVEAAGTDSAPQRERGRLVVRLLIDFLSDVLALHQQQPQRRTEADDLPLLEAMAAQTDTEKILLLLERCLEADRHIVRKVQLVLCLEGLLDGLAQRLE
jgi:DNA polymerase III subunit delta'